MHEQPSQSENAGIDTSLPDDDLAQLEAAFNMLGKHRFGGRWEKNMARRVRPGQRSKTPSDQDRMARWALRALTKCVQNGWLPLFYFEGAHAIRRVEYYHNCYGLTLEALYSRPMDSMEINGQIELSGGDIFPCIINLRNFDDVLVSKFGSASKRRGPQRKFRDFDVALDRFFETHPYGMIKKEVIPLLRRC